jgi:flagellar hook-associated protein 2
MGTIGTTSTGLPTTTIGTSAGLGNSQFALGGLASGMDTTTIVQEMMQIEAEPEAKLKLQLAAEQARQSALQDIQTQLQTLQTDEQALSDPGLWAPTQSLSTSDSSKLTASLIGTGAAPGGYQIAVSALASAWQQSFTYAPPAQDDNFTITPNDQNGNPLTPVQFKIAAGSTITAAAASINSTAGSPVYATVVTDSQGNQSLVLSSRQTGSKLNFTVNDSSGTFTQTGSVSGQDASYTVNGGSPQTSASNVVSNAIPGVQLTLGSLTTVSGPVTVNVSAPQPNQSAIQSALQAFVNQYNATIADIQGKLSQTPVSNPTNATDAGKGVLYGDIGLTSLLDQLRESVSGTFATGNTGFTLLSQIGISTGAPSGSGQPSQSSIDGQLTFDTSAFATAMASNPTAVQTLVGGNLSTPGFAQAFDGVINPMVQAGGVLSLWITDEQQTQSDLNGQISDMDLRLQQKQAMLQAQFTAMETALQQSQSLSQSLSGQFTALSTPTGL